MWDGVSCQQPLIALAGAIVDAKFLLTLIEHDIQDLQPVCSRVIGTVIQGYFSACGVLSFPSHVLDLEAKNIIIMDCVLDRIFLERFAKHFLRRPRKITLSLVSIFLENGRSSETVPEGIIEEVLEHTLGLRRDRPVALVHDESNPLAMNPLVAGSIFLSLQPFHDDVKFLNGRDDHLLIIISQLLHQVVNVLSVIDIHNIALCVGLEGLLCLCVQRFPVDQEYAFLNRRDVLKEVPGALV